MVGSIYCADIDAFLSPHVERTLVEARVPLDDRRTRLSNSFRTMNGLLSAVFPVPMKRIGVENRSKYFAFVSKILQLFVRAIFGFNLEKFHGDDLISIFGGPHVAKRFFSNLLLKADFVVVH